VEPWRHRAHGGETRRELFRDVLIASASIPVFFRVLIHVRGTRSTTTNCTLMGSDDSAVCSPADGRLSSLSARTPARCKLYLIINGQLAQKPAKTPVNTPQILARQPVSRYDLSHARSNRGCDRLSQQLWHDATSYGNSAWISERKLRRFQFDL